MIVVKEVLHPWLELHGMQESLDVANAVRPTRLLFCSSWKLDLKNTLTIEDEFESIESSIFPLEISRIDPLFLLVFWEGYAADLKPLLTVRTPEGHMLTVRLPALKEHFFAQVQVNSLIGFVFKTAGTYRFSVSEGDGPTEKDLVISPQQA